MAVSTTTFLHRRVRPTATPPGRLRPELPYTFNFDRLGVRVPAILISPWVQAASSSTSVYEHASIPATATKYFSIGADDQRTDHEKAAATFLNLLSLPTMRDDSLIFNV